MLLLNNIVTTKTPIKSRTLRRIFILQCTKYQVTSEIQLFRKEYGISILDCKRAGSQAQHGLIDQVHTYFNLIMQFPFHLMDNYNGYSGS